MTVSTSTNSVVYRGNGAATQFAVPYKVLDEDHLVVRRRLFTTGAIEYTYIGTDYSYSGIGADSGTLTLAGTALADTYELLIERIVPYTQDLDIVNAGGFYPETVEEQLDLMTMEIQQVADLAGRGAVVPVGEAGLELPKASVRAAKFLAFDAAGLPIASMGTGGGDSSLRTDLAAATGATLVGKAGSGTVQDALTANGTSITTLEANTKVDMVKNRVRIGDNVGPTHITTGVRTQGGANLDGTYVVLVGNDIALGADNDITVCNAFGSAIWGATGAKVYGCDVFSFRGQGVLADGAYVASFSIDALKDITYGRNSNALAPKAGLHVVDIRSSTLLSVLSGAGGGAVENALIGGLNACDFYGLTGRVSLKDVVVFGVDSGRGMTGDLDAVVVGNSSVQALSVTGTQFVTLGHAAGQARTTSSFCLEAGYGSGSTITTENYVTSVGPLANGKYANSSAFGANTVTTGINQVQLGDATTTTYAYGAVQDRSDARDKMDISDNDLGLSFLREVRWRKFLRNERERYVSVDIEKSKKLEEFKDERLVFTGMRDESGRKIFKTEDIEGVREVTKTKITRTLDEKAHKKGTKKGKRLHLGIVAQELDKVCKKLGVDFAGLQHHAFDGEGEDVWSVGYQEFFAVQGRAIQELADMVDELKAEVEKLKKG